MLVIIILLQNPPWFLWGEYYLIMSILIALLFILCIKRLIMNSQLYKKHLPLLTILFLFFVIYSSFQSFRFSSVVTISVLLLMFVVTEKEKINALKYLTKSLSFIVFITLIAGEAIARKNQKSKFVVYSVDAIPAPIGWSNNDVYFRKVRSLMSRYIPKTDVFFSANKQMLEYQLSFIKTLPTFSSDVLYNPSSGVFKQYETTPSNPVFFCILVESTKFEKLTIF